MSLAATPFQLPSGIDRMIVAIDVPGLSTQEGFDYFTSPERLIRWWPPEANVEPRAGGIYRMSWPAMNWELTGHYIDFVPGERLVFTWQWAHRPELPTREVEVKFKSAGNGCQIVVTHGHYGNTAVEQEDRQNHIDGWIHFLGQLAEKSRSEV